MAELRKPRRNTKEYDKERNSRPEIRERAAKLYLERTINNPEKIIFLRTKTRAKKYGIPFDISVDDIKIPEVCPVLGIPLVVGQRRVAGKAPDNSPSIDKIIPSKGYIKGNIAIISWRANQLKSDATLEEITCIANYMNNKLT